MTHVFLVGAGPGDPDLLTVKALRLLQSAEVVLYDSLVGPAILALANPAAALIDVGKRCGRASTAQARICALLVAKARTGRRVVRLKGGDPMIFGRATEEMEALRHAGIGFEIVPGITAASTAAAMLELSLTQRGIARSLHFVTGHGMQGGLPEHDWVALARAGGTLAIYMGARTLSGLAAHFIEAGMAPDMPALAVENAGLPHARLWRSGLAGLPSQLAAAAPQGPVLILIGHAMGTARAADTVQAALMAE